MHSISYIIKQVPMTRARKLLFYVQINFSSAFLPELVRNGKSPPHYPLNLLNKQKDFFIRVSTSLSLHILCHSLNAQRKNNNFYITEKYGTFYQQFFNWICLHVVSTLLYGCIQFVLNQVINYSCFKSHHLKILSWPHKQSKCLCKQKIIYLQL